MTIVPHFVTLEYCGHPVTYRDDGWFNATQAAAKYGQEPYSWLRQNETLRYLAALAKANGNSGFVEELNKINELGAISATAQKRRLRLAKTSGFVQARAGSPETGGGTWLHPKLAVAFARWLNDDFAVWCDEQIENLIRGKQERGRLRHAASASYKVMSMALDEHRKEQGKSCLPHHYQTEAKLVNWALVGKFQGLDRDKLSTQQLDLLAYLEVRDTLLLARGVEYEKRKADLQVAAETWRAANAARIQRQA